VWCWCLPGGRAGLTGGLVFSGPPAGRTFEGVDDPDPEDVVVRQYRYLLRTAPADALEAAHVQALSELDDNARAAVLRAVQTALVCGLRLSFDQPRQLAHLITLGERRVPGAFLAALERHWRRALADHVVLAEASFALFGGYAAWDGSDPDAPEEVGADGEFAEPWRATLQPVYYRGYHGGPASADLFGGAG
jgi:hypothetical protein